MKKRKKLHCSVIGLLVCFFFILLIVMTVCIFYMQSQKKELLISISSRTSQESLERYTFEFDNRLKELEDYLYSFLYKNEALEIVMTQEDEVSIYYAKEKLAETLHEIVQLNNTIDGVWLYAPDSEQFLLRNAYNGITNQELTAVRKYIINAITNNSAELYIQENRWFLAQAEGENYLFWITPVKECFCGGWINISGLYQKFLDAMVLEDAEEFELCSTDGKLLVGGDAEVMKKNDSIIRISQTSTCAELIFAEKLDIATLLRDAKISFDYALFTGGVLALLLLFCLTYAVLVFRPFRKLLDELSFIGKKGDPALRITVESRLDEVQQLTVSVNQFLEESQKLRIQMYETRLNEKNVNCQYLQIRLKTHFVLNCLSIIYTLTRAKKYDLVEDLVMCLTKYFRFTEFDTQKFVPLKVELEHIRNYAHIQEMRFPEVFEYQENVPESLYQVSIPPLILQTFIENSVSHGMSRDRWNYVRLSAMETRDEGSKCLFFKIADNGRGFSEQTLERLSSGDQDADYSQLHGIGIKNVLNRLTLLYGNQAKVDFYNNREGGATVSIKIPYVEFRQEENQSV